MKKLIGILILGLVLTVSAHAGEKGRPITDKAEPEKQVQKEVTTEVQQKGDAVTDDTENLNRLSDLTMEYDEMVAKGAQEGELNRVRTQIAAELRRGIAEEKGQAKQAKKEGKQEVKEMKKQSADDAQKGKGKETIAAEKAAKEQVKQQSKEAKGELKESKADAKQAGEMYQKKQAVAVQLREVQRKMDEGDNSEANQHRYQELLKEYGELSRHEVKMGIRQMKKDSQKSQEGTEEKGKGSGKND